MLWKAALAGTAAIAIVGSSLVYAQERGRPGSSERGQPNIADMRAFADARLAALHAGLGLTPDQEKNWPAFEQALRDMAQLRIQRIQERLSGQQQAPATPFDRLDRRADAMAKRSAALKKVADSGAPLYQSLNDDQKARFMKLARILRPHPRMHAFMERGWRQGEGQGGEQGGGHGWQHGRHFGQSDEGKDADQGSQL